MDLILVKEEFDMGEEYLEEDDDDDEDDDFAAPVTKKTKKTTKVNKTKSTKIIQQKTAKVTNVPLAPNHNQSSTPILITTRSTAEKSNGNSDLPKILHDPENAYGLHIAEQMRQFASFEREILRNKINNMVFTAFIEYQKRKKE